ncbi:hypothetical protein [Nonomuraea insulae]|uniref:Uncharacterized protein n=1 Tax=Nonomuraea insulae TaxID=1616787 RepID=A0ABW1CTW5_9ACTN
MGWRAAGRSRHARRRTGKGAGKGTGKGRVVAGALVLAGGVVVLLGANGVFSGSTASSGAALEPGAGPAGRGSAGSSEPDRTRGSAALSGGAKATATAQAGVEASAEARTRELQRSEAPKPSATPEEAGGMVAGSTAPEDVLAEGPDPADGDDFRADGPSRHTDRQAAEYFRTTWGPDDKALKRLKDIRTVGGYLRIYTDLPESADNSLTAITLCERGLAYLHSRGVPNPVVFVQAEFGGNGNPVLANILGPSDRSCRVTHPAPD